MAAAPGATPADAIEGLGRPGSGGEREARADQVARGIVEALAAEERYEPVPLRLDGTPFRVSVWEALMSVPSGELVTYSDLAEVIGRPSAVRAVASACASNRLGLVVPCHRVVRADGSTGGYRWGADLKQAIIESERPYEPALPQTEALAGVFRAG